MKNPPRIIFPEGDNKLVRAATARAERDGLCQATLLVNSANSNQNLLELAMKRLAAGEADGVVAGVDFTTREVILAAREFVGVAPSVETFCSMFVMNFPCKLQNNFAGKTLILADGGVVKNPSARQLADIISLTAGGARAILGTEPRVAVLSFSTFGSGGKDETISKIHESIELVKIRDPDLKIDGEMQLDAAINPRVAAKKAAQSSVAGRANVLICPDLNSGNILYKSLEQFAGAHAFGPILLGFKLPISDLSRGSTEDDIYGSIKIIAAQIAGA